MRTGIPPGQTAPWYRRHRPCAHCVARVMRRRELAAGPILEVMHAPDCAAALKREDAR